MVAGLRCVGRCVSARLEDVSSDRVSVYRIVFTIERIGQILEVFRGYMLTADFKGGCVVR